MAVSDCTVTMQNVVKDGESLPSERIVTTAEQIPMERLEPQ